MKPVRLTFLMMMLLLAANVAAQEEFFDDVYFSSKSKKNKVLDTKKDIDSYEQSLMIDFCQIIKQFGNLTASAVDEYIKDNLVDMSMKDQVLKAVDTLEISTIDILKSIVDEVNIHGEIEERSMLNIPKAKYKIDIIKFAGQELDRKDELKAFLRTNVPKGMTVKNWLEKEWRQTPDGTDDNQDLLNEKFDMNSWFMQVASSNSDLYRRQVTNAGKIVEGVDAEGFFVI